MFEADNRLEEILQAAFLDPGHRPEFYRLLLDSDLFVIGKTGREGPGEYIAGPGGEEVSIAGWKKDNKTLVPVFTSLKRLSEVVSQPTSYIQVQGRVLLEILDPKTTVLLNPGCEVGKELPPEEVRALVDGSLFGEPGPSPAAGAELSVERPEPYPAELAKALRTLFAKHRVVQAAFLARLKEADQKKSHLVIGLLGDGDIRPAISEANLVAKNLLKPGEVIDFLDVAGDRLSLELVQKTPPFYKRQVNRGV